jgi:histidinol-phosphate aminotransferase
MIEASKFENTQISTMRAYKLASHRIWEGGNKKNMLKLDWNEATIQPSPKVLSSIKKIIEQSIFNYYPDVDNIKLYKAISNYCKVVPSKVQYFSSSDYAHEYIARCFLKKGDKVLIAAPTYDNFRVVCESMAAELVFCQDGKSLTFSNEVFCKKLQEIGPKLAYICNPNNPTGDYIEINIISELLSKAPETLFVIDEAYIEFSQKESTVSLLSKFDNLIITRTFSKAFALANFRIGYIVSNEKNIGAINKIRNSKNISTFAQVAAIAALEDIEYTNAYVREVNKAKEWFVRSFKECNNTHKQVFCGYGNFVLIEFNNESYKDNFIGVLSQNEIFVRDLSHIEGMKSFVRITIGVLDQMKYFMKVLNLNRE